MISISITIDDSGNVEIDGSGVESLNGKMIDAISRQLSRAVKRARRTIIYNETKEREAKERISEADEMKQAVLNEVKSKKPLAHINQLQSGEDGVKDALKEAQDTLKEREASKAAIAKALGLTTHK